MVLVRCSSWSKIVFFFEVVDRIFKLKNTVNIQEKPTMSERNGFADFLIVSNVLAQKMDYHAAGEFVHFH